jgi:hypothetical protein
MDPRKTKMTRALFACIPSHNPLYSYLKGPQARPHTSNLIAAAYATPLSTNTAYFL